MTMENVLRTNLPVNEKQKCFMNILVIFLNNGTIEFNLVGNDNWWWFLISGGFEPKLNNYKGMSEPLIKKNCSRKPPMFFTTRRPIEISV